MYLGFVTFCSRLCCQIYTYAGCTCLAAHALVIPFPSALTRNCLCFSTHACSQEVEIHPCLGNALNKSNSCTWQNGTADTRSDLTTTAVTWPPPLPLHRLLRGMPFRINSLRDARRQGYRDSFSTGNDAHMRSPRKVGINTSQLARRVKFTSRLRYKAKIGYLKTTDKEGLIYLFIIWTAAQLKKKANAISYPQIGELIKHSLTWI